MSWRTNGNGKGNLDTIYFRTMFFACKESSSLISYAFHSGGASGILVGWGTMLGSIPDEVIGFFNWPNASSRTISLGSTQPLTEMSTKNLPRGKGRPARESDNLIANYEPIV
jgi:hypothetical protein